MVYGNYHLDHCEIHAQSFQDCHDRFCYSSVHYESQPDSWLNKHKPPNSLKGYWMDR